MQPDNALVPYIRRFSTWPTWAGFAGTSLSNELAALAHLQTAAGGFRGRDY